MKVTKERLLKALRKVKDFVGENTLRLLLERIVYDLSLSNPKLKDVLIPEDPLRIDLSAFSDKELEEFYYLLADIGGVLVGESLKETLLKEVMDKENKDERKDPPQKRV